jgi:hypothetical protein
MKPRGRSGRDPKAAICRRSDRVLSTDRGHHDAGDGLVGQRASNFTPDVRCDDEGEDQVNQGCSGGELL